MNGFSFLRLLIIALIICVGLVRSNKATKVINMMKGMRLKVNGQIVTPPERGSSMVNAAGAAISTAANKIRQVAEGVKTYPTDGFRYLGCYDLECNCSEIQDEIPFECIELPFSVIDLYTNKVVKEFHTYVRPTITPVVTDFCSKLTGITNEMAQVNKNGDPNPTMEEALEQLHEFVDSNGFLDEGFVPMSFGEFDGLTLQSESHLKGYELQPYLKRWINIKRVYPPEHLLNDGELFKKYRFNGEDMLGWVHQAPDGYKDYMMR